jgi:hypothetical protein
MAFAISAMGERLDQLLDVTIVYPRGVQNFWDFLCGSIPEIQVRVRTLPIGPELRGDYFSDRQYRRKFQSWLNDLWTQKDAQIEALLKGKSAPAPSMPGISAPHLPHSPRDTAPLRSMGTRSEKDQEAA